MAENLDWKNIIGNIIGGLLAIILAVYTINHKDKDAVPGDDKGTANYFRDHFQCNMIIEEVNANSATLTGIDVLSKKEVTVLDRTKWTMTKYDESKFQIGDTLIKEKGKYDIIIKSKKGTKILPMVLGDKTFSDLNKTSN